MAETQSPLSGGLRAARTTVSSNVFGGEDSESQREALGLLRSNQTALASLSTGLLGVQQRVNILGSSLTQISTQITQSSTLEQIRLRQEQDQERKLAEQGVREGKESVIEKKIQGALIAPVQSIAQRTQGVLERLKGFFVTLLAGWLANQGIEAFRAYQKGAKEKLENIKNSVLSTLGVVGGIFLLMNGGFGVILRLIGGLAKTVFNLAKFVGSAIFVKPFQALINAVRGGAAGATAAASRAGGGILSGIGQGIKNIGGRLLGPAVTGAALTGLDIASGEDPARAAAGAAGGMIASTGAFVLGSAIPLPGTGLLAGGLAYQPGQDIGKNIYDKFFGKKESTKLSPISATPPTPTPTPSTTTQQPQIQAVVEPKNPMMGQSPTSTSSASETTSIAAPIQPSAEMNQQTTTGSYADYFAPSSTPAQVASIASQTLSTKMAATAPLPEPEPTVVVAPTPSPQMMEPTTKGSSVSTQVPPIASSNPENFYIMYSQMQYNVVM